MSVSVSLRCTSAPASLSLSLSLSLCNLRALNSSACSILPLHCLVVIAYPVTAPASLSFFLPSPIEQRSRDPSNSPIPLPSFFLLPRPAQRGAQQPLPLISRPPVFLPLCRAAENFAIVPFHYLLSFSQHAPRSEKVISSPSPLSPIAPRSGKPSSPHCPFPVLGLVSFNLPLCRAAENFAIVLFPSLLSFSYHAPRSGEPSSPLIPLISRPPVFLPLCRAAENFAIVLFPSLLSLSYHSPRSGEPSSPFPLFLDLLSFSHCAVRQRTLQLSRSTTFFLSHSMRWH